ncbi:MAG: DNA translocase FtsK, partial [Aphanizomenon sp.]
MHYLTEASEIYNQISQLSLSKTLWIDTEIADCYTKKPKLALIQVLADYTDLTGESAYIFDVLDKPDLAVYFINQIMVNPQIEKVFHNAGFDLKYLGKELAQNVTCTLKIAKKITKEVLQTTNLKLKTLAAELCQFSHVDAEEGSSDWGKRPLTQKQLNYAAMDTVYLAAVHYRLLEISNPDVISRVFNMVNHKSENSSLTPTKVRLAFECPRLFYLNHHFNCKAIFSPKDTLGGVGNVFHKLADDFINLLLIEPRFKNLFNPSATQLNVDKITSEIQQLFYQIKFFPYLQDVIVQDASKAPVLLQVWQGLQGLIKKFTELLVINRRYCSAETLISNTFISGERNLEYYFDLPNGTKQLIRGEFDCLVFNFELKRLYMVEFKTYQPVDSAAQLAQVSLYSYMLSKQKKTPVDSAVYCVLPEFKEYKYSWEQLENTVHQLIPYKLLQMQTWLSWESPNLNPPPGTTEHYLCEICPQQQKCQTFFGVEFNHDQNSDNADKIGEDLVNTLQSFGIGVEYHGAAVSPAFIRVKLKPNSGVKVNSILKLSADLQVQLGLNYPPLIAPQAGYVSVDLPRQDRQIAKFEDFIQKQFLPPTAPVKIAIGVSIDGKLLEADLSDPNTCHFLVGGTTGSGKSEFLRSLLLSLIYRHSPQHLKIALV